MKSDQRVDLRFGVVLLLLCLAPFGGYWLWKQSVEVPSGPVRLIGKFDEQTTVELVGVAHPSANAARFWSPNGVVLGNSGLDLSGCGAWIASIESDSRVAFFRGARKGANSLELLYKVRDANGGNSASTAYSNADPQEYVASTRLFFRPDLSLMGATEIEVLYASNGIASVKTLSADQTESVFDHEGIQVKANIFPLTSNGKMLVLSPRRPGDADSRWVVTMLGKNKRQLTVSDKFIVENAATFSTASTCSSIEVKSLIYDRKLVFSDIAWSAKSYTAPKVSDSQPK